MTNSVTRLLCNRKIVLIVSGGAQGADKLAEKFAEDNKIDKLIFKAEWDLYGPRAGMIRNEDIVKNSDVVIAFWDGKSKGTNNSIGHAKGMDKELHVVIYKEKSHSDRLQEILSKIGK